MQGITYWVINDRSEIRRFINSNVKHEWERDNQEDGVDSRKDDWLLSLPRREWVLRTLESDRARLNPSTMARRSFTSRLKQRSDELRHSILEYHAVIWPLRARDAGALVSIKATPTVGHRFIKWSSGTTLVKITNPVMATTTARINGPGTITATFT